MFIKRFIVVMVSLSVSIKSASSTSPSDLVLAPIMNNQPVQIVNSNGKWCLLSRNQRMFHVCWYLLVLNIYYMSVEILVFEMVKGDGTPPIYFPNSDDNSSNQSELDCRHTGSTVNLKQILRGLLPRYKA